MKWVNRETWDGSSLPQSICDGRSSCKLWIRYDEETWLISADRCRQRAKLLGSPHFGVRSPSANNCSTRCALSNHTPFNLLLINSDRSHVYWRDTPAGGTIAQHPGIVRLFIDGGWSIRFAREFVVVVGFYQIRLRSTTNWSSVAFTRCSIGAAVICCEARRWWIYDGALMTRWRAAQ